MVNRSEIALNPVSRCSSKRWPRLLSYLLYSVAASLLSLQLFYALASGCYWQDLWLSRDQQGAWYFKRGLYSQAAARFKSEPLVALADYAAENFDRAAQYYKKQHTARAYYNLANSLAHQEHYGPASEAYKFALLVQPGWAEAKENLELVTALNIKKSASQEEGGSDGELGADDIAFDLKKQEQQQATQVDEMGDGELGEEQLQELWLRRLNTRPVDFLRRKFAYQLWLSEQRVDDE